MEAAGMFVKVVVVPADLVDRGSMNMDVGFVIVIAIVMPLEE
jgi:hypothetical protein